MSRHITGERRSRRVALLASGEFLKEWDRCTTHSDSCVVFVDADSASALDTLMRKTPEVVLLDPRFAVTAKAAALIKQLVATMHDAIDIRILPGERPAASFAHVPGTVLSAALTTSARLFNHSAIRKAVRIDLGGEVQTVINGAPATLINVSVLGAQLVSSERIRPSQHVRLTLSHPAGEFRLAGVAVWVAFEAANAGGKPQYRLGIEFTEPNPDLQRFRAKISQNPPGSRRMPAAEK